MRKDQAIIPTLATRYGNADVKPIAVVERPRCFSICGNHSVTPSTPTIRQKYENVRMSTRGSRKADHTSRDALARMALLNKPLLQRVLLLVRQPARVARPVKDPPCSIKWNLLFHFWEF